MRIPFTLQPFFTSLLLIGLLMNSSTAQDKVKLVNPSSSKEWYQFRGPDGMGHSDATGIPLKWSPNQHITWKTPIPGNGWSSPVIVNGKIYFTSAVKAEQVTLHAICVDADSGDIVWDKTVFEPNPDAVSEIHSKNSLASPTPIVIDGKVYVHFGHMGTAALDLEGNIVWKQNKIEYPPMHGNGGSPAIVDDLIVFSCDGREKPIVAALNRHTGEIAWTTPRKTHAKKSFSFCTPLIIEADGKKQIILPGSGFVGSYNPTDGKENWRVEYGEGYSVVPRPVLSHDLLFVSSSFDNASLYAVNPVGAKQNASKTHTVWSNRKAAPHTPSTIAVGDEIFMVSDGGVASCMDAKTGTIHWSERLGGNFSASPICVENRIYFLNETGTTFVVKADKKYELLATNDLDERTLASPAVSGNSLYIRTDQNLYKIQN